MESYNTDERVILVNNTGVILSTLGIEAAIIAHVKHGTPLSKDFADLFDVRVVTRPSGSKYAVVNWA